MPLIPLFLGFVASVIGFIIRHPFVSKMMIFALFTGLLGTAISFMLNMAQPYVLQNDLFALAGYLGVLDAISMFLTIVIAGWGVKQVLAFVRS